MELIQCMEYYGILGVVSFLAGRLLPKSWFSGEKFPFRSFPFERDGAIYNRIGIRKWQKRVPDMSRLLPKLMPEKKLGQSNDLTRMVQETCVAELIHVALCFAGLYTMKLWKGFWGAVLTAVYILLGNVPFILIQRYNRPRLLRLMKRTAHCASGGTGA